MERDRRIQAKSTKKSFQEIEFEHEQNVFDFLHEVNPALKIQHHPYVLQISPEEAARFDQRKTETSPDFLIENPVTGKRIYLEVTEGKNGKRQQKNIANTADPNTPYIRWKKRELDEIEEIRRNSGGVVFENYPNVHIAEVMHYINPQASENPDAHAQST